MRRANSSLCGGYIRVAVAKDDFAATVKVMNKKSADARAGLQMWLLHLVYYTDDPEELPFC